MKITEATMRGILGLAPLDLSSFKGQSLVKKQDDSDREVFSVSPTATEGQVHKAYFKLSIAHHPDKFTDPDEKSTANLRFNELTEIYERLVASTSLSDFTKLVPMEICHLLLNC